MLRLLIRLSQLIISRVGWSRGLGYSPGPHDPRFREFRRLFHQFIGPRACQGEKMIAIQEAENRKLLNKLLDDPDGFLAHFRQSAGSLILKLAYGYNVVSDHDQFVQIAENAMAGFARASEPGRYWVDNFPFRKYVPLLISSFCSPRLTVVGSHQVRYIPEWLPGANFKIEAREMRKDLERLYDVPYNFVKQQMVRLRLDNQHSPLFLTKATHFHRIYSNSRNHSHPCILRTRALRWHRRKN
jgi:hypothetical protein